MTTGKSAIDLIATIRPDIATRTKDVVSEPDRERLLHAITSATLERSAPSRRRTPVHRRPVVLGAFAAGAAALAVVTVVVIPSGGGGAPTVGPGKPPSQVLDAAYVVKQLTAAVANADNDVVHTRTVVTPAGSAPGAGYVYDQWYRSASGASRMVSTGTDGTICLDDMATGVGEKNSPLTPTTKITAADHQNRSWWTWSVPNYLEWPVSPACATAPGDPHALGYDYPAAYTSVLAPIFDLDSEKDLLAVGQLHLEGNGPVVDGQRTIKLSLGPYPSGVSGTVLVNATTYRPLSEIDTSKQGARVETDVQFLPPTTANLAQLTLTVPAGYRQVTPQIQHGRKKK